MYLGNYQLGDTLSLMCTTTSTTRAPVTPDAAPTATIYDKDGNSLYSYQIPQLNNITGYFGMDVVLGLRFTNGPHVVHYSWAVSSTTYGKIDNFSIEPGGRRQGTYVSMFFWKRPQSSFIIGQTDAGLLIRNRNPRLE